MTNLPQKVINREFGTDSNGHPVTIADKYQQLKKTIINLYGKRIWFLTDAALSVVVSCLLTDLTNPVGLIFVDGPSTGKTTVLDFFDGLPMSYRLDKFTPASFMTQSGKVRKKDLAKVDLLPKIVYKTVLIPEMAQTFNQSKEILLENYATLARVFDGTGLVSAGGIHGERALKGDYVFSLLGATTPLSQMAWNTMGKVGSRLLFLNAPARLSRMERQRLSKEIMTGNLNYKRKRKLARAAIHEFVSFIIPQYTTTQYVVPEEAPEDLRTQEALMDHCGYLPRSVEWQFEHNVEETVDVISLVAEFVTGARKDLTVWKDRGENSQSETTSSGAVLEGVERFTAVIYNLARGHALVSGRSGLTHEDLPLIVSVGLSSLPDDRRTAFQLLVDPTIAHKESEPGQFRISELCESMSCAPEKAKLLMKKLEILGLGKMESSMGPGDSTFTLDDYYEWFLTDEFRQCYRPWDAGKRNI